MTYERTTGTQCVVQKHRPWTPEEDELLRNTVEKLGAGNWKEIAKKIPGRTTKQCYDRWNICINPKIKKGPWTPKEDELLRKAVEKLGTKHWKEIAKIIPGRTARQCRGHWNTCHNPNLNRGPWTPEEDRIIIKGQRELGNQWEKIALLLPRRADNMVKNRWYNTLQKQTETQDPQVQPNLRRACIYLPEALQNPQGQPTIHPQQPLPQLGQGYPGQPTIHQQPLQPAQSTDAGQPDTDSTTNYAALFDASEDFERTFDEYPGPFFDW